MNNLEEINILVHEKVMNHSIDVAWADVPEYSRKLEDSWRVANKVNLFDDIIIVKGGRHWVAFRKGIEQPLLFGDEDRAIDFLEMKPIAMGNSFPETICRAALVLQKVRNEQSNGSNQRGDFEYPQVSS